MRISDWSSDVCSSDLGDDLVEVHGEPSRGSAASVLRDTGRQGSGTAFVLRSVPLNWCLILGRMRLSARFCLAVSRCVLHSRPVSVSWGGSIRPPRGTAEQGDEEYQAVSSAIGGLLVAQSVSRERSEEHTSELQSLMRISYAVFCLKKKHHKNHTKNTSTQN